MHYIFFQQKQQRSCSLLIKLLAKLARFYNKEVILVEDFPPAMGSIIQNNVTKILYIYLKCKHLSHKKKKNKNKIKPWHK